MPLVPAARASIRVLPAENKLPYLSQETLCDGVPGTGRTTEEFSHGESDRRRAGCLFINSVLFAVDPADHFVKFGSQLEEADRGSCYRHRLLTVVHLEEGSIRNGISCVKSERVIPSLFGGSLSKRMERLCYNLPIDRCPMFSILVLDKQPITFN